MLIFSRNLIVDIRLAHFLLPLFNARKVENYASPASLDYRFLETHVDSICSFRYLSNVA